MRTRESPGFHPRRMIARVTVSVSCCPHAGWPSTRPCVQRRHTMHLSSARGAITLAAYDNALRGYAGANVCEDRQMSAWFCFVTPAPLTRNLRGVLTGVLPSAFSSRGCLPVAQQVEPRGRYVRQARIFWRGAPVTIVVQPVGVETPLEQAFYANRKQTHDECSSLGVGGGFLA